MGMVSLGIGQAVSMIAIRRRPELDVPMEPALVPQASAMRLLTKMLAQAIGVAIALSLIAWKLGANDVVAAATNDPLRAEAAFQWLGMLLLVPAGAAVWLAARLPAAPPIEHVVWTSATVEIAENEAR